MKSFVFPFETLLEHRRGRRNLCRQLVAQLHAEDQKIRHRRDSLQARHLEHLVELRQLGRKGRVDVDRAASHRHHADQLAEESQLVEWNQRLLARQLTLCRDALIQADQDVKVLEKLKEYRQAEYRHQQSREAARHREEAWLGRHAREYAG